MSSKPTLEQVIGYTVLGLVVGSLLLADLGLLPDHIYLYAGLRDPNFENKIMFVITLGIALVAGSFSFGYILGEGVRLFSRRAREFSRYIFRNLTPFAQRIAMTWKRWRTKSSVPA